jgi:hypothetical protein
MVKVGDVENGNFTDPQEVAKESFFFHCLFFPHSSLSVSSALILEISADKV